ncbi:glycosyltransferase family 2 protein [Ekhidna sp.]
MLISVIIPAYQAQKYITETVDSVLNQTYKEIEIIVVNDGSTDNTEAILATYQSNAKVKVLNVENGGVSRARNIGFQESNGAYVAFLDADDVWDEINLELKANALNGNQSLGLVHSNTEVIDGDSKKTGQILRGKQGEILKDLLLWNGTCIPAPSSILVRREVVQNVGGFEESLSTAADQEFFFRVANQYPIGMVDQVTWFYRVHDSNMHQNIARMESDHILAYRLAERSGFFESRRFRNRCFSNLYLILGASWWGNGNGKIQGIKFILKALLAYPPNTVEFFKKLWRKIF